MAATSSSDDVQLPDLRVIQRYSLAVRGASAPRDEVIAALSADLEWLRGSTARRTPAPAKAPVRSTAKVPAKAPAKRATKASSSGARKA